MPKQATVNAVGSNVRRVSRGKLMAFVVLCVGSVIMILPFFWMISSSFKPAVEILRMPPQWLPSNLDLTNFRNVLELIPFTRFFMNSVLVSVINTAVSLFSSALTGYVFAKYDFWGRDVLFLGVLGGMMIPFQVIMIPLYKIMIDFGWVDTYSVLTIPYFYSIFGVFLMRQFMLKLPDDLLDAATIDGCSHFGTFFRIVIPLVKPAFAALGIFLFMGSWNDYLWPLIVINSIELRTLPLGLGMFIHQRGTRYDLLMAASLMTVLPMLVVFLAAQRQFVEGIALTGLKG